MHRSASGMMADLTDQCEQIRYERPFISSLPRCHYFKRLSGDVQAMPCGLDLSNLSRNPFGSDGVAPY